MTYDYIKSFPKCHAGDAITVSYNVPCDIALITERDYQLTVNRDDDSFLLRVSADEIDECHASMPLIPTVRLFVNKLEPLLLAAYWSGSNKRAIPLVVIYPVVAVAFVWYL